MTEDEDTLALDNVITDDDRAIFMMDEISRAARKAFDDRAQPLGLNRTQWRVLAQLIKDPALNQTDIARRLELESATIGLAVTALTQKGFIERRRDPADGRVHTLWFTPAGRQRVADLAVHVAKVREQIYQGLSTEQLDAFAEVLLQMETNVRGMLNPGEASA